MLMPIDLVRRSTSVSFSRSLFPSCFYEEEKKRNTKAMVVQNDQADSLQNEQRVMQITGKHIVWQ